MDETALEQLAHQYFKEFVLCIHDLLVTKNISFDAIVGAGNSGLGMAEFTRIIYQELGLVPPPVVPIAIFRKGNRVKNEIDQVLRSKHEDVQKHLPKTPDAIKHILIPDDEIGHGRVVGAAIEAMVASAHKELSFTVVAENHGYDPKLKHPDFDITVRPFGEKRDGIYSIIFFVVTFGLMGKIKHVIGPQEDDIKYANNLLLGLPTKELIDGQWEFVHKHDALVKESIPHFEELQDSYRKKLHTLVKIALS